MSSLLSSKRLGFFRGHYNILFIGLIVLFIFRPDRSLNEESIYYLAIWKLLLTGTILAAIFNCKHSHKVKLAEVVLAIPTVLLFWWDLYSKQTWSLAATTLLTVLFTFLCTISIIHDVFIRAKVTFETLRGVICAYFLLAIGFAYLFWFIEWLAPGTFFISHNTLLDPFMYERYISEMLYFSFVTLLTVGYGDIVAVKDLGQTVVVIEGFIGQFYMAILVARLVAIYSLLGQLDILKSLNGKKKTEE